MHFKRQLRAIKTNIKFPKEIYLSISNDFLTLSIMFRAIGLPIGSGEVESAHRYIPQKRLKIPEATWHPNTVNPMLALRIMATMLYSMQPECLTQQ